MVGEDRSNRRMRAVEMEAVVDRRHHEVHSRWIPRNLMKVIRIRIRVDRVKSCVVSVLGLLSLTSAIPLPVPTVSVPLRAIPRPGLPVPFSVFPVSRPFSRPFSAPFPRLSPLLVLLSISILL